VKQSLAVSYETIFLWEAQVYEMRCIACILDDARHCEVRLLIEDEVTYSRRCEDFSTAETQAAQWQRLFAEKIFGKPAVINHQRTH
jgi:hypothetical protein